LGKVRLAIKMISINFIKVTIAPILMGEKRFCVICDKDVEIVKVITHGNYDVQILSCDHIGRKLNLSREERERETSLH
jgi:hypothetical protein